MNKIIKITKINLSYSYLIIAKKKIINAHFSDIKEDIAFIKERLKEKENEKYTMDQAEKDKYMILDNNREENPKGWFW